MSFPQRILVVKELTFILPPDFKGDLTDALDEYIKYRRDHIKNDHTVDPENKKNTVEIVLTNKENIKSCILYGIIEIDDQGNYTIIESSSSTPKL